MRRHIKEKGVVNVIDTSIYLKSSLSAREVANRVSEQLFPGWKSLKWEVLDHDEIPALGLVDVPGFEIVLSGDETWLHYVLEFKSSLIHREYLDERKMKFEELRFDISDQLFAVLEGMPDLKAVTGEEAAAAYQASLTDEDRFWMSDEGRRERWRQWALSRMSADDWSREPRYAKWEALGYDKRMELLNLFVQQTLKNFNVNEIGPSGWDIAEFLSKQTGIPAAEIPGGEYMD